MSQGLLSAALLITIIVSVSLTVVVVIQSKKIKQLTTPKYGFLGKSLALSFAFSFLTVGGSFALGFNTSTALDPSVSVSTDEIYLRIDSNVIDELNNIYMLNVVPVINNADWKGLDSIKLSFIWEINGVENILKAEKNLSRKNPGGIIVKLKNGANTVEVQTNYQGNEIIKRETINIDNAFTE